MIAPFEKLSPEEIAQKVKEHKERSRQRSRALTWEEPPDPPVGHTAGILPAQLEAIDSDDALRAAEEAIAADVYRLSAEIRRPPEVVGYDAAGSPIFNAKDQDSRYYRQRQLAKAVENLTTVRGLLGDENAQRTRGAAHLQLQVFVERAGSLAARAREEINVTPTRRSEPQLDRPRSRLLPEGE